MSERAAFLDRLSTRATLLAKYFPNAAEELCRWQKVEEYPDARSEYTRSMIREANDACEEHQQHLEELRDLIHRWMPHNAKRWPLVMLEENYHRNPLFHWPHLVAELLDIAAAAKAEPIQAQQAILSQIQFSRLTGYSKGKVHKMATEGTPLTLALVNEIAAQSDRRRHPKGKKDKDPPTAAATTPAHHFQCLDCKKTFEDDQDKCSKCGGGVTRMPRR